MNEADDIAATMMQSIWSNPAMKLSTISQAAANFAKVAAVAHDLGLHDTCNTCMNHIIELLKQIKNEPTP